MIPFYLATSGSQKQVADGLAKHGLKEQHNLFLDWSALPKVIKLGLIKFDMTYEHDTNLI